MATHGEDSTSTPELIEELQKLNVRIDAMQVARHKANSEFQVTLTKLGREAIISSDRFEQLEDTVEKSVGSKSPFPTLVDDTKEIKRVLFGDDKRHEKGLVQRFDEVDTVVKKALYEQRAFFTIMAVIGAVIVFSKSTGVLKFLTGP